MTVIARPFAAVAALALFTGALAACAIEAPPPAALTNRATIDERAVLRAEQLYQAAATVALAAGRSGIIPAAARPAIARADRRAYAALQAFRAAYAAGRATGYAVAEADARVAIDDLLRALRG